jgi:UPF0042 nucleotide-binding protein
MATKQILVLTGLAGAGKSTAAKALEDVGFFVVDNLPPRLIGTLVELADSSGGELRRMVFVVDAREARFLADFGDAWDALKGSGHDMRLVFLDCDDDVLVRRFKETRRRHPLDEGDGISAAIQRERGLLVEMRHRADDIIRTGDLSPHDLKRKISERYSSEEAPASQLTLLSFGFKHGLPPELDLCFDARFLPNPYFIEALRKQTGLDDAVYQHVLEQADSATFLDRIEDLVTFLLPRFHHEGKSYVTVAIGCTGGRHRSVSLARALGERLSAAGVEHKVVHRDVEKH